jgi:hypothetical protein
MQTALKLAYVKPASKKKEITSKELTELLKGYRITLDCGHHFTVHHFSLTMIVYNDGQTNCHN